MRLIFMGLLLLGGAISTTAQPVIGLSCTYESSYNSVPNTYITAVQKAGGVPVLLPVVADTLVMARMLDAVDAVIFTGGEDFDPLKWYGQEPLPAMGTVVPRRDFFDITLLRMAVARHLPVMGICRGQQALNVAFGGSLYQDLPTQLQAPIKVSHSQKAPREYGWHSLEVVPGSLLAELLGASANNVTVNSFHHQAVRDLAPCLEVMARAKDGVIEAVQMKGNPAVFGVQFHPEGLTSAGNDTFMPLFEYLVKMAGRK